MTITATTSGIPRYRAWRGPALLAAGFRPFFLLAALWSAAAVPLWLAMFGGVADLPVALAPQSWHAHEMIYGYAAAAIAGFFLTAIPNWTGRMPLQGLPLGGLVMLWLAGRVAELMAVRLGPIMVAAIDLAFLLALWLVVAREILAGRNWRNAPMLLALGVLVAGNLLVHLAAIGAADTAVLGLRLGIATLLMLISLIGGRIVPSFTLNWMKREKSAATPPAPSGAYDRGALAMTGLALMAWVALPEGAATPWLALVAGLIQAGRLARWRGWNATPEPLLWVLHLGYAWVALGFLLQAANAWLAWLPPSAALHAWTAGAIGTMPLAVMTRATLGHTGRPLHAGAGTTAIYALVTLAALVRLVAPAAGDAYLKALWVAGAAWCAAFGLYVVLYFPALAGPTRQSDIELKAP